jgi:hypothetical protein
MNKRIFPTKTSEETFFQHNIISSRETCDMNNSCIYIEKHEMERSHLGHEFTGSLGLGKPLHWLVPSSS